MKSLEQLKQELEVLKKPELVEDVIALIEEQKNIGVDLHRKQNQENQNLRKFKKSLESLGFSDAEDLDGFTASLIDLKTKATSNDGSNNLTLKSLNEQIKTLTNSLENERKRVVESENKVKNKTLTAKLTQALTDKVYGADLLIKSLIDDKKVDLDGEEVIFKDNDINVPFTDGLNKLLESRKDIVKSTQVGGAGTTQNNTVPKNIDAIIKSNDMKAISANFKEVASTLGLRL